MGMAAWGGQQPQTKYWDNVTGLPLETWRVEKAREDEIKFFQKQGVYDKVPRAACYAKTGRSPVRVRWVDVNKGDEQNPDYRSRLVAMEFKTDSSAEWFSGTPPLEALRFVCSDWASSGQGAETDRSRDQCMVVIDVKKAHLRAPATREVFVELPKRRPDARGRKHVRPLTLLNVWHARCRQELGIRSRENPGEFGIPGWGFQP